MSKHPTHRTWLDRLLAGVLCLALTLSLLPVTGLVQTADAAHWAAAYADKLKDWEVLPPEWQWTNNLDAIVKRSEFVALCNRAFGYTRLGEMPFVDVSPNAWYYQDINIAYNAGYFSGDSDDLSTPKASPDKPLNREMAVVAVAVNLMLQQTVGESLGFTDSHRLSSWSANWVGAAVAEGVISGYPDGSFRPQAHITRGELVTLLVGLIGTPLSREGSYNLGDVYGNVVISNSHVTLRDTVVLGNLYITGGVDLGSVLLENVTVLGRIVVAGGGVSEAAQSSVILRNVVADELVIDSLVDQSVTVSAYGITQIPNTYVRYEAYLEDSCAEGYGLQHIELDGEPGTKLQLAGSIKEVVNKTPRSSLQLVKGTAKTITVDEKAKGSELLVDINTRADVVNLDVGTYVYGEGDILYLNIWAEGCEVDILPEHLFIRPGLTAIINGEIVGSTAADELSQEPRLLSGYPAVDSSNLRPTSAEGLYAGNKPGTIYWAVSAVARGSVLEKDLLKNPAYGGNIYEGNSGSINVTSRGSEYSRLISELEPDGSYYISAILVDERGNHSPVKVISFTTPDDTTPAFVEEPHMTKVTCDVAQVTTMVNKNCQLYWVLLPHGAAAPTARNFQTGSFGGNYGYGSIPAAKNVPISLQVNTSRLREKTGYDLYLWLNDLDGTKSSEVVKVLNKDTQKPEDPSFITPDQTPPIVSNVTQTNFGLENAIEFTFEVNEAPSILYWAVVTETDDPFLKYADDQLRLQKNVQSSTDPRIVVSGSKEVTAADTTTAVSAADFKSKLTYKDWGTHTFLLYYVARDADNNYSEVRTLRIYTLDKEVPEVTVSFSSAMYDTPADIAAGRGPRPQADTNITLTFTEQVKGESGLGGQTFVDLYNEVARYEGLGLTDDDSLLKQAKDDLGEVLAEHIKLYYVKDSKDKPGTELKPKGENTGDSEFGWLDLREAVVKLDQSTGEVTLTLTNGKAVQLGGGKEYYFYFEEIFDDSQIGNPLMTKHHDGSTDGGIANNRKDLDCETDHFVTVYALVWLSENEDGISEIKVNGADIPLDMVVDVDPASTGNTGATDCWDMVIWCDLAVRFDVYRRVDEGAWELAAKDVSIDGLGQNNNATLTAASLSRFKTTGTATESGYIGGKDFAGGTGGTEYTRLRYDTVTGGLQMDHIYQYGLSFTRVNDSTEREAWTSLVQMKVGLVAGAQGNVQNLSVSNSVYNSYLDLVETRALLDVISSVDLGNTTKTILEIEHQFSDERVPEFTNTSPTFTVGTGTIDISLALSREGTVYYVVAPADGTITTSYDGQEINYGKDGRGYDAKSDGMPYDTLEEKAAAIAGNEGVTNYIPVSGMERASEYFGDLIDFSKFTAPTVSEIYRGSKKGELVRTGSITYEGVREPIRIAAGLAPDRWYYVYLVLQSTSNKLGTEVQIYRVHTNDVEPPVIIVGHYDEIVTSGNTQSTHVGVNMTINDRTGVEYDSPVLNYALAQKSKLPGWFSYQYLWTKDLLDDTKTKSEVGPFYDEATGGNLLPDNLKNNTNVMTLLEAMLNRPGENGESYFDLYANEDLKKQVMQYVTQATSADQWGTSMHYYPQVSPQKLAETRPWLQDCTDQLTMEGEYVMLICARNYYKESTIGSNFGFAAVQGLYKPDDVPPELTFPAVGNDGTVTVTAGFKEAYNPAAPDKKHYSVDVYGLGPQSWNYTGTIRITFDKPIYVYEGQALKQVVAPGKDGKVSDGQISILDLIGGSVITGATDNATHDSFTLTYTSIRNAEGFTLSRLFNSSGNEKGGSSKTLTVTFDTSRTEGEVYVDKDTGKVTADFRQVIPCFNISWR